MNSTNKGFTLIELLVAMAVLALTLTFVISSFGSMFERQRLQASVENTFDLFLVARTESISRNSDIYVSVVTGSNWCYGIGEASTCDCSTSNSCQIDGNDKVISSGDFRGVKLSSATFSPFHYDRTRGFPQLNSGGSISESTFTFQNNNGDDASVKLNSVGRLSLCSSGGFRGYKTC